MKQQINGSTYHVLNFIVATLMEHAFKLACEVELVDLKGLIKYDSLCDTDSSGVGVWDVELELLKILDDNAVVQLVKSIDVLIEATKVYRIINNCDLLETILDDELHEQATDTFYELLYFEATETDYKGVLTECTFLYCGLDYLLCGLALQHTLNKFDVFEELDKVYYDLEDNADYQIDTSDKDRSFFETLRQELSVHANEIMAYENKLDNKEWED